MPAGRDQEWVERLVAELEGTVEQLARDTSESEPEWYRERLAEIDPEPDGLLDAHLFLLDCPLPDGQTPIWRLRERGSGRAIELLSRSEFRVWRLETAGAALGAQCPLGTGSARLEAVRCPSGAVPGSILVARSVPVGPQRWALLGMPSHVAREAVRGFERLLASLNAPPGEFWRVHGGVLARAAAGRVELARAAVAPAA